ncbi:MAG: hypothetical protein ACHQLA_00310 [Ignavibacteriales bacterium]
MIVASIDIGTNTVLLLIAEVDTKKSKLSPIFNEYRLPRIGQDTKKSGTIRPDKLKLLFEVLSEYESIIKKHNCNKVIVTGTYALRIAKNSNDIYNEIKRRFNYELNIITGNLEAEYAYLGAISGFNGINSAMVIDIGGGSTELIFGDESKINFKTSIQIGSVSATEQFFQHSPPLNAEIQKFREHLKTLIPLEQTNSISDKVIAVAGTATTLGCMNQNLKEFSETRVEGSSLNRNDLNNLINEMCQLTAPEILNNYGQVMLGREDIILVGAIILGVIMDSFGIEKVILSSRGIRYGAIVHWLNNSGQS